MNYIILYCIILYIGTLVLYVGHGFDAKVVPKYCLIASKLTWFDFSI